VRPGEMYQESMHNDSRSQSSQAVLSSIKQSSVHRGWEGIDFRSLWSEIVSKVWERSGHISSS
jgi:hypothetical protein